VAAEPATVYVVKGVSRHGYMHRMIDELGRGFEAEGYAVRDLWITADGLAAAGEQARAGAVRAVVNLNFKVPPARFRDAGLGGIPLVLYTADPPYHSAIYMMDVLTALPKARASVFSPTHLPFARRIAERFDSVPARIHCLPHGATPEPALAWTERDVPAVLAASLHYGKPPEALREGWQRFGRYKESLLNDIVDACNAAPERDIGSITETVFGQRLARPDEVAMLLMADHVDYYLRQVARWQAALSMLDIPGAVICGLGWESLAERNPRATLAGPLETGDVMALIRRAKVVVNAMSAQTGSYERVFEGISRGALVVSTWSSFWVEAFGDTVELVDDPADFGAAIRGALDGDNTQRVARARERLEAGHTWRHRARVVLDLTANQ